MTPTFSYLGGIQRVQVVHLSQEVSQTEESSYAAGIALTALDCPETQNRSCYVHQKQSCSFVGLAASGIQVDITYPASQVTPLYALSTRTDTLGIGQLAALYHLRVMGSLEYKKGLKIVYS